MAVVVVVVVVVVAVVVVVVVVVVVHKHVARTSNNRTCTVCMDVFILCMHAYVCVCMYVCM